MSQVNYELAFTQGRWETLEIDYYKQIFPIHCCKFYGSLGKQKIAENHHTQYFD